LNKRNKFEFAI